MKMRAAEPTVDAVQTLCQRVRSAGSPNARARPPLVTEYRRLAETLGVAPLSVETGIDLQRAAAGLLRAAARPRPWPRSRPPRASAGPAATPFESPARTPGRAEGVWYPSRRSPPDRKAATCGDRSAHRE